MDNQFYTQIAPYFQQQDQGLGPVFQNIGAQQATQNAALAQQNQQIQDAGAAFNQSGGMNPLAMAMMLRGKKPNYDGWQTTGSNQYFGSNTTGQGAGLSPDMLATLGLGK